MAESAISTDHGLGFYCTILPSISWYGLATSSCMGLSLPLLLDKCIQRGRVYTTYRGPNVDLMVERMGSLSFLFHEHALRLTWISHADKCCYLTYPTPDYPTSPSALSTPTPIKNPCHHPLTITSSHTPPTLQTSSQTAPTSNS